MYQGKHEARYVAFTREGTNELEVFETEPATTNQTLTDIIQEGYALRGGTMTNVEELIYIPPTNPESVENIFRSWLTMSGHTAYTMGVAKANGAAQMTDKDAYDYLHRNLYPYKRITSITITFHKGNYGVHVYGRDE